MALEKHKNKILKQNGRSKQPPTTNDKLVIN